MRRRSADAPPFKNRNINVPVDDEEYSRLARAAALERLPLATWLRRAGLAAAEEGSS